jgi:ubiquinone/menaquinone biosynthesis C-methylase UbiE
LLKGNGMSTTDIKEMVREKYAEAALRAEAGRHADSGNAKASCKCGDKISSGLYDVSQIGTLPEKAVLASLGCGNPTALAELKPGETVLDLGSGGGIDVLLSARRVGPSGKGYGLDMTDEMLALANENKKKSGLTNVEFLKGDIENIPLPEACVDVVISNCVINLSVDKDKVFREVFRVLKPGGRFAVSDIVRKGEVPAELLSNMVLWAGCAVGALKDTEYSAKLASTGFTNIAIETTRVYTAEDGHAWFKDLELDADKIGPLMEGKFASAFIRATKPS